jgi:hypothetical protein
VIWAEKIGLKPQQWGVWPTKMEVKAAMTMEYNGINLIDIYRINIVIRPQNKGFKQHKFWSNFEKMKVSKHNQDVRCNVDISDWDTYVCAYCIYVYVYIYILHSQQLMTGFVTLFVWKWVSERTNSWTSIVRKLALTHHWIFQGVRQPHFSLSRPKNPLQWPCNPHGSICQNQKEMLDIAFNGLV